MNLNRYEMAYRLAVDSMNDYCASRLLIQNKYALNSIQLACTAVEKILKSFLYLQENIEVKFEHNPAKIYRRNKQEFDTNFNFNINYFKWLGKVYESRYTSNYGGRKEILFGEKHFLSELDSTFHKVFSYYRLLGLDLNQIYFNEHRSEARTYENYIFLKKDKIAFASEEQRLFAFQLFGVNNYDYEILIKVYNPEKPFIFRDSVLKDGNALLDLDVGKFHIG